jgi:uncharacterized Zn finger protein (UPF0148 family)
MDCPACGYKNLPNNGKFCPNCGENITQASKKTDFQIQISQINRNSEATGMSVRNMNAGTIIIQSGQEASPQPHNVKNSFCSLIEWIYDKSDSLERLQPAYNPDILKVINRAKSASKSNQQYLDFTDLELEVLELVFNFCHYYLNDARPRCEKFVSFKQADYYLYVNNLIKDGKKIRVNNIKLSSIIADKKMSKLVQKLE